MDSVLQLLQIILFCLICWWHFFFFLNSMVVAWLTHCAVRLIAWVASGRLSSWRRHPCSERSDCFFSWGGKWGKSFDLSICIYFTFGSSGIREPICWKQPTRGPGTSRGILGCMGSEPGEGIDNPVISVKIPLWLMKDWWPPLGENSWSSYFFFMCDGLSL